MLARLVRRALLVPPEKMARWGFLAPLKLLGVAPATLATFATLPLAAAVAGS